MNAIGMPGKLLSRALGRASHFAVATLGALALLPAVSQAQTYRVNIEPSSSPAYTGAEARATAFNSNFGSDGTNFWNSVGGAISFVNYGSSPITANLKTSLNQASSVNFNITGGSGIPIDSTSGISSNLAGTYIATGRAGTVNFSFTGLPANTAFALALYATANRSTTRTADFNVDTTGNGTLSAFTRTTNAGVGGSAEADNLEIATFTGVTSSTGTVLMSVTDNNINSGGEADWAGVQIYVTPPPAAPTVTTNAATSVTTSGATLNGTVSSNGAATAVTFQYSTNSTLSSGVTTTTTQNLGSNATGTAVSQAIGSLAAHTTYYYKAVGASTLGTTNGSILNFTTSNTNPTAPNGTASGTTGDQQTLPITFPTTDADGDTVAITSATAVTGLTVNSFAGTTVTFTPNSNFTGSGSFTYTVGDGHGGAATGTITVALTDNDPPLVAAHANVGPIEATGASGALVTYPAGSATDNVTTSPAITYSQNSGTVFPIGVTTVNITATDGAGNAGHGSFTVTVRDSTPPSVGAHLNVTAEATDSSGAIVNYANASASDAVGVTSLTYSQNSGTLFPIGVTTVNITAMDAAGNAGHGSFTVTVQDTTAPSVNAHANVTAEATDSTGAIVNYANGTATDAVGVASITYSQNSGTLFPIGTTTVTITAKDAAGNSGTGSFTVTVHDTTAPSVNAHANVTAEATDATGAVVNYANGSATDAVGVTSLIYSQNSGTLFPIGTTTVTMTAKDAAGNSGSGSFTVTVHDTTAPSVNAHANVTVEATGASGATVNYSNGSATDAVGVTSLTYSQNSGTLFPIGTTTVTITASDAASNAGHGSFTVTVYDTTAPSVATHANVTAEATDATGAIVNFANGSATDAVGVTSLTYSQNSGTLFPVGTTTVTITATDAAGNSGHGSFTVTVHDTTAPTLTLPSDITVRTYDPSGAVVTFNASGSDGVDGSPTVTAAPPSGSLFPVGVTTVYVQGKDSAGNTTNGSFTVTVQLVPKLEILYSGAAAHAGDPVPGLAGATFKTFGVPSINDSGDAAFMATYVQGLTTTTGIFDGTRIIAIKGHAAPGVAGATFATFQDPGFNNAGDTAFFAVLNGPAATAKLALFADIGGTLQLVQRRGVAAPDVPGATVANLTAATLTETGVFFMGTMTGSVTTANNTAVWYWTPAGAQLRLRTGQVIGGKTLKIIAALQSSVGSLGQGRSVQKDGIVAHAFCTDTSELLVYVDGQGTEVLAVTKDTSTSTSTPKFSSLQPPILSADGGYAFRASVLAPTPTPEILASVGGASPTSVFRQGDPVPGVSGAKFSKLFDPIFNGEGVADLTNISIGNSVALAYKPADTSLQVVAQVGTHATGLPPAAKWRTLTSIALPPGLGPTFIGTLALQAGVVDGTNNVGIWAADSDGTTHLLVRTGDLIDNKKIIGLTFLSGVFRASDQSRSFNSQRQLLFRATLAGGSQRIIRATMK